MERKEKAKTLKQRIRTGDIRRQDVTRRLAELAFGKANDCVKLALEENLCLEELDLSLLSEVKRNEKGKRTGLSHRGKWDVGVSSHVGSSYK